MANTKIAISWDETTKKLVLTQLNGTTVTGGTIPTVNRGDTVTWLLNEDSGIKSIDSIICLDNSYDIFGEDPAPTAITGIVTSLLNKDPQKSGSPINCNYTVNFTLKGKGGRTKSDDPTIQLNP